jgi:hypothetical protein
MLRWWPRFLVADMEHPVSVATLVDVRGRLPHTVFP